MHEVRFVAGWNDHLFVGQEVCDANGTLFVYIAAERSILGLQFGEALVVYSLGLTSLPSNDLTKGGITIVDA